MVFACQGLLGCNAGDPLEPIRQQQAAGRFQQSLEPLRELLAERPEDPEANYLYGRALAVTGQPSLATWSLRKAMEDPAWRVPAGLQLAYAALVTQDFNVAVEAASRILEHDPDQVQALLLRAQAYAYWRNDPEKALADANRVLELDPDVIEAFEPKILALLALDRHEEARAALAEGGERLAWFDVPASTRAWHCATTAILDEESGDPEGSREQWSECLAEHPTEPDVVWGAVKFHEARGERERSIAVLRAALAGLPESAPAARPFRVALAERLRRAGDGAEAEALLREAVRADNRQLAALGWIDLARYHRAEGAHGAAADAIGEAFELASDGGSPSPELAAEYADALVMAGRLDRAEEIAREIEVPAQREILLARVAQERGDPRRALAEFDEALRLWPDNAAARYYAAAAAAQLGDFERALEEYRYSVRISASATDARERGARLLEAEGKPLLALHLLEVNAGHEPLGLEGQILGARLSGRLGDTPRIRRYVASVSGSHPGATGRVVAEAATGVARRAGPDAALGLLRAPGLDLSDPDQAAALRALVRFAHEAGAPEVAADAVRSALAAHPESAVFHEIRGLSLELSGAPREEVRAAYERAVEIDPEHARALAGLARAVLESDPVEAAALYARAAAADPSDPSPKLEAARALIAAGKSGEAADRLDELLLEHPYEAQASLLRAQLDLDRGAATEETLERAQRAERFGGGPEALELLSEVHARRGETERAQQAAERARAVREQGG